MAIAFINRSSCQLCQLELKDNDELYFFPSFIQNTKDPYYEFNDCTFHLSCLHKHPLSQAAIQFADEYIISKRPENRICIVSGDLVKNYDDYIFIDLLTSNKEEPLFEFNFKTLDKNKVREWSNRSQFVNSVIKFKNEGKWGNLTSYDYLETLIDIIK